ncbi:hypothetical protein CHARACLAT_025693 [Characodon lateralis]|uniref:Secreted protein n=1 Tax=Characodon lateralis TaxID=208331 RepID=A0ABU7D1G0_9TELE|nr:hypothetical protein [Characodon lateralis]
MLMKEWRLILCVATVTVACIDLAAITHTEHGCSDGRNLQQNQDQAQCERPSATTDWTFENRAETQKEQSTDPGVLSIRKKREILMGVAPLVASSRRERQLSR